MLCWLHSQTFTIPICFLLWGIHGLGEPTSMAWNTLNSHLTSFKGARTTRQATMTATGCEAKRDAKLMRGLLLTWKRWLCKLPVSLQSKLLFDGLNHRIGRKNSKFLPYFSRILWVLYKRFCLITMVPNYIIMTVRIIVRFCKTSHRRHQNQYSSILQPLRTLAWYCINHDLWLTLARLSRTV